MKFQPSLLTLASMLVLVHHVKAQSCSFTKDFGSGVVLSQEGEEAFQAASNAVTTCSFTCGSGTTAMQLYLRYGGSANAIFNDKSAFVGSGCGTQVTLTSGNYETTLGWSLTAATFVDLKFTCSCSSAGTDPGCFSADMTVDVLGHDGPTTISIKDLKVGDMVKSTSGYQQVYSFGHRHETQDTEFVQLYTHHDKAPLELTKEHLIFVDETHYLFGFWPQQKAIRADDVKVGDVLLLSGSSKSIAEKATVTAINAVTKQGAFMPLTPDGTILVNGIQASTYVSIADQAKTVIDNFAFYQYFEQNLNQWWLSPYRMLCMGVSSKFCSTNPNMVVSEVEDAELSGILKWLLMGRSYAEYANDTSFFTHHILGIPTALFFGFLLLTEKIVGPSMAPTALAALVSLAMWRIRQNVMNGRKIKKE